MVGKSEVFDQFVATTSIRGVSAIARAQSVVLRILWCIAVLTGVCVGLYFVITLLIDFFSYNVVVRTVKKKQGAVFPDVTICPLNPLSNMDYDHLTKRVQEFVGETQTIYNNQTLDSELKDLIQTLQSPGNIFININISDIGMNYDNWINMTLDCNWYMPYTGHNISCFKKFHAELYKTEFGFCQTFQAPQIGNGPEALGLIIFMRDISLSFPKYTLKQSRPFASGLRVMVHDRGTLPDLHKGVNTPMGHYSEVIVSQSVFNKLDEPYSDCSENPSYPVEYKMRGEPFGLKYNYESCISSCLQYHIMKNCSCVDGDTTSTDVQRGGLTFCRQFVETNETDREGYHSILNKVACVEKVKSTYIKLCRCEEPCDENEYMTTTNLVVWPHDADKIAFYKQYVKETDYDQYIDDIYENIILKMGENNEHYDETYEVLKKANDIRINFANVQVMLASNSIMEYKDEPAMTVVSMVGSLGGNLNLWIGITLFTLVEISDFLYRIVFLKKSSEEEKNEEIEKLHEQIKNSITLNSISDKSFSSDKDAKATAV